MKTNTDHITIGRNPALTIAIVQARLLSTRLPGKVLADVCGQPMLARQMARMQLAQHLDEIVVAIPESTTDDTLAAFCVMRGWALFRGSETDVLGRYLGAAEASGADTVVRVTADCPLIDPFVIDAAVLLHRCGTIHGPLDFVANNLVSTFPHFTKSQSIIIESQNCLPSMAQPLKSINSTLEIKPCVAQSSCRAVAA